MDESTNDLRTLIVGSSDRVVVKDKRGVEHVLQPLDLSDLIEYEEKTGGSLLRSGVEVKIKDMTYIIFLSLRKEGLSDEDIRNRRFKVVERDVNMMFDLGFLAKANDIFVQLLRISGLEVKDDSPNPPQAPEKN